MKLKNLIQLCVFQAIFQIRFFFKIILHVQYIIVSLKKYFLLFLTISQNISSLLCKSDLI